MYSLNFGQIEDKIRHPLLLSVAFLSLLHISAGYIDCRISCRRCHENTEHPSVLEVYCAMCEECKQRRREKIQGRSGTSTVLETGLVPEAIAAANAATAITKPVLPPSALPDAEPAHELPRYGRTTRGHTSRRHSRAMRDGDDGEELAQHPYAFQGLAAGQPILIPGPPIAFGYPAGCPTPAMCEESEEVVPLRATTTTTTTTTTTIRPTTPCPPPPPCKKKKAPQYAMAPMMPMMPCMPCMMNPCSTPCPGVAQTTPVVVSLMPPPAITTKVDYQYVYIGIPKHVLRSS